MRKSHSRRQITGVEIASPKRPLQEPRLWGTWKSDRKKTFEHVKPKKLTPQQTRKLRSWFGKLVHIWTRTRVSTYFDCDRLSGSPNDRRPEVCRYSVVARDETSVVVLMSDIPKRRRKADSSQTGESEDDDKSRELLRIQFDGDAGYRISLGSMSEYFSRIE